MSRRLIADGQLFQTIAWHRGMGKYSLELLSAVAATGRYDLQILLSGRVDSDRAMLDELRDRVPGAEIVPLDLRPEVPGDPGVAGHNRTELTRYLGGHPGADFLLLSALQGLIRPVVPLVPGITTHALVYDLIPLMLPEMYLRHPAIRAEYLPRVAELLRADRFLTISRTVANDLAGHLGVAPDRIATIDGAPIRHSVAPVPVDSVTAPFVLMPTGNDLRKNNRRAIRGFDRFNRSRDRAYTLVVTSTFRPEEVAELSTLSPDVLFTGNLSGGELADLYQRATALLFPPEYEGLGLPVLEAMQAYKPVACSDIPVFREVSDRAFCLFDPLSIMQIARALGQAVDQDGVDRDSYDRTLARYTWERTADLLVRALERPVQPRPPAPLQVTVVAAESGSVGAFVQDLHAELSRRCDLRYLTEAAETPSATGFLSEVSSSGSLGPGLDPAQLQPPRRVLHHVSGSSAAALTLLAALAVPGVLVLHDTDLTAAWDELVVRELVGPDRIAAEDRIEAAGAVPGTAHLGALLALHGAAVVASTTAAALVAAVADRLGIDVAVQVLPPAVPGVVYPDALPPKTIPITMDTAGGNLQQADLLARSRFAVFDAGADLRDVLRAARVGTVPCLPFDPETLDWPAELSVRFDVEVGPDAMIAGLLTAPEALDRLCAAVRHRAATVHDPARYASALTAVIASGSGAAAPVVSRP